MIIGVGLLAAGPGGSATSLVQQFRADETGAGAAALRLARLALDSYARDRERVALPASLPPLLLERGGVFVSSQLRGAPRCCMGTLYPRGASLAADLVDLACRAAAYDQRFPPLRPEELPQLQVIVSFLDPPEPTVDPLALDPLTEGLAVRGGQRTGVVLPGETGVRERFVQWGEIRAGLRPGARARYFRLEAVRYMEPTPGAARRPLAGRSPS